ncbi:MAG: DUF1294 domain-containing protein [Clostridiales bacterium]|nr:DUF1294 domain-containing protein [Clostridiales bacterium]
MVKFVLGYIAVVSIITFFAYGADKSKAKKNKRRTPEKVLLGLSFIGGAVGGILGMNLFRHKTKHWYFWVVNVLSLIIHAFLFYLICF